jgi:hypothetical protein
MSEDKPELIETRPIRWTVGDPVQNVTKPIVDALEEIKKALMAQQKILMKQRIDLQNRVK